ncbi:putative dehydrogenase [Actinokineospora baliensis]|uniref:Gfo/Idh/MocA family protein n=1 Tax=Actinokineospora baliensis TaxID=547056 RepID=UPI0027DDCA04|nr:Gfo/Idh/MocA family oxidoreductase [Actinokineospora baliensis]MBM7772313.1 putative dehydrogenase [Actinokineospora baliensis]
MELRIGVIGFGLRSTLIDYAHRPGGGSRVVAVCDPRPARRSEAARRYGAATCATAAELLRHELDAVFVLSPDHLHAEHAVAVLESGRAAYVEKPLATTVEDCDRILAAAVRTGSRLYVGHNMRHMPVVTAMRDLIAEGAVGRVTAIWCRHFVGHGGDYYFKDWHAERAKGTGLLLQKGAHDIDVIHWLAGGYSRTVSAMGALTVYGDIADRRTESDYKAAFDYDTWPPAAHTGLNPVVDVEDLSMVTMALDNGVFATYQQCHYTPDYWRNYTVIGTEGRVENFGDGPGALVRVWNRRHRGYAAEGDLVRPIVESDAREAGHGGADPAIVAEFVRFAHAGGPTATSPVAARNAVATACAATDSLRAGGALAEVPRLADGLSGYFEANADPGPSGNVACGPRP